LKKTEVEFRYYTMPADSYVLPKLGKGWEQEYGLGYGEQLHFHNYAEIGYCYNGHGRLIIDDREYRYEGNMLSFIPERIPHTTISDPGNICKWEFLFIDIDNFVKNEMGTCGMNTDDILRIINKRGTLKSKAHHERLDSIVRAIIEECRDRNPYYAESLKGYLRALVVELLRLEEEREAVKKRKAFTKSIEKALSYVDDHYAEDVRISDMADACALSESHFRRTFENIMQMKPLDYVNFVRVKNACDMLEKSEDSIQEVSYKVGFPTLSTFNRNFRKVTGTTPNRWRRQSGDQEQKLRGYHISAKKGWEA